MIAFVLLAFLSLPQVSHVDSVDVAEVNCYLTWCESPDGIAGKSVTKCNIKQVIFWERIDGQRIVRDWCMASCCAVYPDDCGGAIIFVRHHGRSTRIHARAIIYTETFHDPERENRRLRPECERRKIWGTD